MSAWRGYSGEIDNDGKALGYGENGWYSGTWRNNKNHGFGKE